MISIDNVYKRFGDETVFSGFTEHIDEGEFVFLTGESGSGKSTLIRMLLMETEPDSGSITVNGQVLSDIPEKDIPYYRRSIGVIFQDFRLFDDYTVYGNLDLTLSLTSGRGKETEMRITNILKLLGIDRLFKRYPKELSGGEKQKVCMARALINDPKVLLADEPTGNLDPGSSGEIIRLLELIHRHGTTVIMATHDYENARKFIKEGRRIEI